MGVSYFITITSQNHSGVLTAVTTALGELGGDMHHASQSIVHGLFTMTIAAQFPEHRTIEVIKEHLLQVGRNYEMAVLIRELLEDEADMISTDSTYYLTVNGQDAPGVVRVISGMLAQMLITIESLSARPSSASTFSMVMRLSISDTTDLQELIDELDIFSTLNSLEISLLTEEDYFRSELPADVTLHNMLRG